MYKKTIAFAVLLVVSGCQSGGGVSVTNLTDQLSGCVYEALDQKGGSVVIKSPAQYSNFGSIKCDAGIVLPEIDFGESVFVAKNMTEVCTLDTRIETSLNDSVLSVQFIENRIEGQECEVMTQGAVAATLSNIPEGVSVIIK